MLRIACIASFGLSILAGIGCAVPNVYDRVDALERERVDLMKRNTELAGELQASQTRQAAMERDRQKRAAAAPAPAAAKGDAPSDFRLPESLQAKGVKVHTRGGETVLDFPSDVFFAAGSSKLTKEGEKVLKEAVAVIRKEFPKAKMRVEGHTDSDPVHATKSHYHCNWDLGFERAHAVVHYLTEEAGVEPKHLVCSSYGPYAPADPAHKAKNRRVEIAVVNEK